MADMHITQWGEYGVHCSMFIALRAQEGVDTVGASAIAGAQNIAPEYAQQILQRLRRGTIIESVRGPQGGYRLARPANQITLRDILEASEGDTFEVICNTRPLSPERCALNTFCGLRWLWHGLRDHVNVFLTNYTLLDLINHSETKTTGFPVQIGSQIAARKTS